MERKYEVAYIFSVEGDGVAEDTCNSVREGLQELKAKIEDENDMGVRDFAYPIRKQTRGHYYIFTVSMSPSTAHALDGHYRHNEAVLRHLVIKL